MLSVSPRGLAQRQTRRILAPMPLVSAVRSAYRKLLRRHPLDDRGGLSSSHKFHDVRTSVHGPDGYGHVNVDLDFKKPKP